MVYVWKKKDLYCKYRHQKEMKQQPVWLLRAMYKIDEPSFFFLLLPANVSTNNVLVYMYLIESFIDFSNDSKKRKKPC